MNRIQPRNRAEKGRLTSIKFPPRLYREAKNAQSERGLQSFSDLVVAAVRDWLRAADLQQLEARVARSLDRIDKRIDRQRELHQAAFSLQMAFVREILRLTGLSDAEASKRMNIIVSNALHDFRGLSETFIGAHLHTEAQDGAVPPTEDIPAFYFDEQDGH